MLLEWPVELLSKMWTGWSGVGDGVDTPQTVMTTRAPAVLTKVKYNEAAKIQRFSH